MSRKMPVGRWSRAALTGAVCASLLLATNGYAFATDATSAPEPPTPAAEATPTEGDAPAAEASTRHEESPAVPAEDASDSPASVTEDAPASEAAQSETPAASEQTGRSAFFGAEAATADDLKILVTKLSDGTAEFDSQDGAGLDANANNGIVRVNDSVSYKLEVNSQVGVAENFTTKIVLPPGLYLKSLPGYCKAPGSSLNPTDPTANVTLPLSADSRNQLQPQTWICNLGQVSGEIKVLEFSAQVSNLVHHDQELKLISASARADGVQEVPAPGDLPSVRASAALKWDLSKNSMAGAPLRTHPEEMWNGYVYGPIFEQCFFDTTRACFATRYNITMSAPAGGKGAMPAVGDVTFTEDLSFRSLYRHLKDEASFAKMEADKDKYGSRLKYNDTYYAVPGGKIGSSFNAVRGTADNSVRDTGQLVIHQANPGEAAEITIRNADFSLRTYPKTALRGGQSVPANRAYAVSVPVLVHTPVETIREFGESAIGRPERKSLKTTNEYKNLNIQGFAPGDTQTSDVIPGNNIRVTNPEIGLPGGFEKYFGGAVGTPGNSAPEEFYPGNGWVGEGLPGGTTYRSGQTGVAATQEVVGLVRMTHASPVYDFTGSTIICDAWDNTKLHLKKKDWQGAVYTSRGGRNTGFGRSVPSNGEAVWITGYNNVEFQLPTGRKIAMEALTQDEVAHLGLVVEYSSVPATTAEESTCGDDMGPWVSDPAQLQNNDPAKAAKGVFTGVGRIRAYYVAPKVVGPYEQIGAGYGVNLAVGYEVAEGVAPGTVIPNFASNKRVVSLDHQVFTKEQVLANDAVPWNRSTYVPGQDMGTAQTGAGGDRLIASDVYTRVNKQVRKGTSGDFGSVPPNTSGGDTVDYKITPSLGSASTLPGIHKDVWVEDCLPSSSVYVSATRKPDVVSIGSTPQDAKRPQCDADATYLRWIFPQQAVNETMDDIIVTTEVVDTARSTTFVNHVEVWAEGDHSPRAKRVATANITVNNAVGLKLAKKALTPVQQVNRAESDPAKRDHHVWLVEALNTAPAGLLTVTDATVIDVLPKNAVNGSSYTGDFLFREMTPKSADAGTWTVEYTATPSAQLSTNPKDASNQAGGSTKWCPAPEGGADGCPVQKTDVTGIRVTRPGVMPQGTDIRFEVTMTGVGNVPNETYTNAVGATAASLNTIIGPFKRTETTVAASIGDRFFIDSNGNGSYDAGEPAVPNATVRLTGTDDLGNPVDVTVHTADDGTYVIPHLRASDDNGYTVTFTIPDTLKNEKYEFTTTSAAAIGDKADNDSNPDGAGVVTGIVLKAGESRVDIDAGIVKPSIDLVKTADKDVVKAGDVINYTFTATNNGSAVLKDVALTDGPFTNGAGQNITLDSAPALDSAASTGNPQALAPGQTLVWTAPYTVKAEDLVLDQHITNAATVNGKSPRDTPVRDEDTKRIPPLDDGAYKFSKEATPTGVVDPGTKITYTVKVSQVGNLAVKNATIEDDLTAVLSDADLDANSMNADSGQAVVDGNKIKWTGDLAKGQVVTITYTVTAKVGTNNAIRNTVTNGGNNKGSCDDAPGKTCTVEHTFTPGKYTLSKAAKVEGKNGTTVLSGDVIKYTVTLKHASGTKIPDAKMVDNLTEVLKGADLVGEPDPTITVTPATKPAAQFDKASKSINWTGEVLPNETITFEYSVRVNGNSNAPLTNVVTPGDNPNGTCEDGDDNCTTTHEVPKGKYQYSKTSPTASPVKSGQEIEYVITVKHTEGDRVRNAEIRDQLPLLDQSQVAGEVTTVSNKTHSPVKATIGDDKALTWRGDLQMGETITIAFKVLVDVNNGGRLINRVTSPDPDGERHSCEPKVGEDDKCETTHEVEKGTYHYWKDSTPANNSVVKTGDTITYTLNIAHKSGDRVKNAVVEDDLTALLADNKVEYKGGARVVNGVGALESDPARPNVIIWKGDLTEGAVVTVEVPVTVTATHGATLVNTLTSPDPDNNRHECKDGDDANCTRTHTQEKGSFVYSKTASVGNAESNNGAVTSGDRIDYTITVKHKSGDAIPAATITDNIASVLDNAAGKTLVTDSLVATSSVKDAPAQPTLGDNKVITWTGDLAEGEVVTIRYSIIVDADGTATLRNTVTTPDGEDRGTCDDEPGKVCRTENTVEGGKYVYSKVSDVQEQTADKNGVVTSGTKITYTLTVAHASGDRVKKATITDNFSAFVKTEDDKSKPAVYNDDATIVSGPGAITVENNVLTWTGDLNKGESTVITFSINVDADGAASLLNAVTSQDDHPDKGRHSCVPPTGEDKDPCQTLHIVEGGKYQVTKTGVVKNGDTVKPGKSAVAGDDIVYTLTAAHKSGDRVKDAAFTDDFSTILKHVEYTSATLEGPGTLTLDDADNPTALRWDGTLEPGQSATVTLTVRVTAATQVDTFTNTVKPKENDPRGECPEGQCEVDNNVPDGKFVVSKSSTPGNGVVASGDTIQYTIVVKHASGTRIEGAQIEDILPAHANYQGDAVATSGTVDSSEAGKLKWTGDLAVGQVVTITYTVKVNAPNGGHTLVNVVKPVNPDPNNPKGSCDGPEDPNCTTTHTTQAGEYTFKKTVDKERVAYNGDVVNYTVTVSHKQGDRILGAVVNDDMSALVGLAAFNKDAKATTKVGDTVVDAGKVTFDEATNILNWTGDLPVGQVVTITYSVTVTSIHGAVLKNVVTAPRLPGIPEPECEEDCETNTPVPQGKYVYSKTSDKAKAVKSGDTIKYTVEVKHTEGDTVVGASVKDELNKFGLLDNATYNEDAKLVSGPGALEPIDPANPVIGWKGDLKAGEMAVIEYTVTVNVKADTRTKATLVNAVISNDPEKDRHSCVDGVDANCKTEHTVEPGTFTFNKTQDQPEMVKTGDKVTYTVVVKHTGGDRILGAQINDNLAGVLGAAKFNDDATVTSKIGDADAEAGKVTFDEATKVLNWTGNLAVGQVVTITYSVTVDAAGAAELVNVVTAPDGQNGECEENCTTMNKVPEGKYVFKKTSDPVSLSEVKPGQKITYTVTIKHKDGDRVLGAQIRDDLKRVLPNATYNDDATATAGLVHVDTAKQSLVWTGDLKVDQEVTITYSVTVKDGNVDSLTNVVSVPEGEKRGTCEDNCTTTHKPAGKYAYAKTAEAASGATVKEGEAIKYTLTVKHVSGEPVMNASIQDDLTEVLKKATYNNDAVASAGKVTYANGILSWTGDLAKEEVVTVVFTVKVTADAKTTLVNKVTSTDPDKDRHSCVGPEDKDCTTVHNVEPKPKPKKPNPKAPSGLAKTGAHGAMAATAALALAGGAIFLTSRRRRND